MDRKDLVKKILELSLELKDAEGVQAMMCITDMENAVKDYEKQLTIPDVSQQRELLPAFLEKRGDDIITLKTAGTDVSLDWQEYLKAGNCG